jgi:hypothetical protein
MRQALRQALHRHLLTVACLCLVACAFINRIDPAVPHHFTADCTGYLEQRCNFADKSSPSWCCDQSGGWQCNDGKPPYCEWHNSMPSCSTPDCDPLGRARDAGTDGYLR